MSRKNDTHYQDLLKAVAPAVIHHFLQQAEKDFKNPSRYDLDYDRIAEISHKLTEALYKKSAD